MTDVLVLGGTSFVGRAVVQAALSRGYGVTTLNRGFTGPDAPGVRALRADRQDPVSMSDALGGLTFDVTVDISGMSAAEVGTAVGLLADATATYAYVSTVSVYDRPAFRLGRPIREDDPVVAADPDDPAGFDFARYGEHKRGGELALAARLPADRRLAVRPGIILGPHENVHRVPYWLGRIAEGGRVLAPGHPDRAFQCVDVDDLAEWLVTTAVAGGSGTCNAVTPFGRDTWADWLAACRAATGSDAEFVWVDDATLKEAGVETGFGLPMWFGRDLPGYDHTAIEAAGFTFRPLAETVERSWEWLRSTPGLPQMGYRPEPITRERERAILAELA